LQCPDDGRNLSGPPLISAPLLRALWPVAPQQLCKLVPLRVALPLLQMPRAALVRKLERLLQTAGGSQEALLSMDIFAPAKVLPFRVVSWEEVLRLMGLARCWNHYYTLAGMAEGVVRASRIAAGGGLGLAGAAQQGMEPLLGPTCTGACSCGALAPRTVRDDAG
jgi:hypothetical protein